MTQEALKLALEALKEISRHATTPYEDEWCGELAEEALTAINALAQPEFIKHEVENADDWSEWVCPDPDGYLMKCCDCKLVHEAQFKVVRYKSETERDDCDVVDDPNLQAVFRMRRSEERSEEWTADDTAHRSGGLPMAQPEQEPVAWLTRDSVDGCWYATAKKVGKDDKPLYTTPPQRQWVYLTDEHIKEIVGPYGDMPIKGYTRKLVDQIEAKSKELNA